MNLGALLTDVFGEEVYLATVVTAEKDKAPRTEYVVSRGILLEEVARGASQASAVYAALQVAEREGRIPATGPDLSTLSAALVRCVTLLEAARVWIMTVNAERPYATSPEESAGWSKQRISLLERIEEALEGRSGTSPATADIPTPGNRVSEK